MMNTNKKILITAILLLLGIKANAQITVKIDSLKYSNISLYYDYEGFDGPPIEAYFTLENHSGQNILAFTEGDPDKPNVCLLLQMQFEYDGKKCKSPPMNIAVWSRYVIISDDHLNYNYKGNVGYALVMHNGESVDGWDCIFFPFEDMVKKYKDPDNRSAEYTRLKKLVPEILPTITIEAYRVERVWNGEHFDNYELTGQCCCSTFCQCYERK